MPTREQGLRRTTTLTVGLVGASLAGTIAVAAAAAANTTAVTPTPGSSPAGGAGGPNTGPNPGQSQAQPNPFSGDNPFVAPPGQVGGGNGRPDVRSRGSHP
jgi:hypothetical protein